MATTLQGRLGVPGLNQTITDRDVMKSSELYNKMPEISTILELPDLDTCLDDLGKLIMDCGLQKHVGIHLRHSHGELAEGYMIIGKDSKEMLLRRIQQRLPSEVDLSNIHGRVFVLDDDNLHPYEYQQGPLPLDIIQAVSEFVPLCIDCMKNNKEMASSFSLEILNADLAKQHTSEIVIGSETTTWPSDRLREPSPTTTTGWIVASGRSLSSANWVGTSKGHQKVDPPQPASELLEDRELEQELIRQGVLLAKTDHVRDP